MLAHEYMMNGYISNDAQQAAVFVLFKMSMGRASEYVCMLLVELPIE